MTRPLKRDQYVRPAKPVIRFSRGATHQDPPEIAIEITGTPRAMEVWARKIAAIDAITAALSVAAAELAGAAMHLRDLGRDDLAGEFYEHAGTALAALDSLDDLDPTTTTGEHA